MLTNDKYKDKIELLISNQIPVIPVKTGIQINYKGLDPRLQFTPPLRGEDDIYS